jgi:hypothetical protein
MTINFVKGLDLCESFFSDVAMPILIRKYPNLQFTAGLIGYGSDVLGYDDITSTDHMWGPRFYLFIKKQDEHLRTKIIEAFSLNFPYTFQGYSVNFSQPDPKDNGIRHPEFINGGRVSPLVFIDTFESFTTEYLGTSTIDSLKPIDWLAFSEHRLLGITAGKLFVDMLNIQDFRNKLSFFPEIVKLYLIASQWSLISEEQAFVKRCGDRGDELGSRIICLRIVERLMRLCFLYKNAYSPYSKWFGTAFAGLNISDHIKEEIRLAALANDLLDRENHLVKAQILVGELHNSTGITESIDVKEQKYFGRNIKVIFAEKFAKATRAKLNNTEFEGVPLIGSLSQIGNLTAISDYVQYQDNIKSLYGNSPCL